MTVNPGEILAARCTYNSTGHATPTKIGHTGGDEMCNLYLMFYTLSPEDDFVVCVDEQNAGLSSQLPPGNDVPLPPNPELGEAHRLLLISAVKTIHRFHNRFSQSRRRPLRNCHEGRAALRHYTNQPARPL